MTKEIIYYPTRDEMKIGENTFNAQGMRSLHTNFKNNDEKQGYRVTFVDGLDDPNNAPELVVQREADKIEQIRTDELLVKIDESTINPDEIKEFLKLKFVKGR